MHQKFLEINNTLHGYAALLGAAQASQLQGEQVCGQAAPNGLKRQRLQPDHFGTSGTAAILYTKLRFLRHIANH